MKFTITGANGFLGVHLIHHLLKEGHSVVGLKRDKSSMKNFNLARAYYNLPDKYYEQFEWVNCELDDKETIKAVLSKSTHVIHTAGLISYNQSDKPLLKKVNADYTGIIVECCLDSKIEKLIYISSTGAISKLDNRLLDEKVSWDSSVSHAFYGFTKYLGELEVHKGVENGLNVSILNPGVILGFGNWDNGSLRLFRNAQNNFPFYTTGVTGFIGVNDIARAATICATSSLSFEQYILIEGNYTFKEIAVLMSKHLDKRPPFIHVSGVLYSLAFAVVAVKEFFGLKGLLTKESTRASISKTYFDNTKIKTDLGFNFTPINQVIQNACIAYKKSPA